MDYYEARTTDVARRKGGRRRQCHTGVIRRERNDRKRDTGHHMGHASGTRRVHLVDGSRHVRVHCDAHSQRRAECVDARRQDVRMVVQPMSKERLLELHASLQDVARARIQTVLGQWHSAEPPFPFRAVRREGAADAAQNETMRCTLTRLRSELHEQRCHIMDCCFFCQLVAYSATPGHMGAYTG